MAYEEGKAKTDNGVSTINRASARLEAIRRRLFFFVEDMENNLQIPYYIIFLLQ